MNGNLKKIVVFSYPDTGHVNPLCCILKELVDSCKAKVICYGNSQIKSIIEKSGAEYKDYSSNPNEFAQSKSLKKPNNIALLTSFISDSYNNIGHFAKLIEVENPDVVIYDEFALYAKLTLLHLKNKHAEDKNFTMPSVIMFKSTIVPLEKKKPTFTIWMYIQYIFVHRRFLQLEWKYHFGIYNIFKLQQENKEDMNIVCVFPEFQPDKDQIKGNHKFVGFCFKEDVRSLKVQDEKLNSVISSFPNINPIQQDDFRNIRQSRKYKLIYASLGTVFNNKENAFVTMIESFSCLKDLHKYKMIIALGERMLERFQEKIKRNEIKVPENVTLAAFTPQVEILKKADVFITHCGMGSANEAIYYAVPTVCIPIAVDQHSVAKRVADELGLGIRLDLNELTADKIANAVMRVAEEDISYHEQILKYSQIMRQHNGPVNATREIFDYIDQTKGSTFKKHI